MTTRQRKNRTYSFEDTHPEVTHLLLNAKGNLKESFPELYYEMLLWQQNRDTETK